MCMSSVSGRKRFSSSFQREMFVWQPFAETPMNGFGMKHGKAPSSRPTCFAIWRKVERLSAVFSARSKPKFSSIWPGASSWSPWIMSSPSACSVLDHLVDDRLELGELVDVVAVGLRLALDRGLAVLAELEPHHLRLHARPQVHARAALELLLDAPKVPAAVRGQERAGAVAVLAVPEAGAPDSGDAAVPRQHRERLRLRDADELPRLGAVADVVAVPVGEEVRSRPVDELEALLGDGLPVLRGNALAHDAPGDGDELVVDVCHPRGVDPLPDLLDGVGTPIRLDEALQVGRHHVSSRSAGRSRGSVNEHGSFLHEESAVSLGTMSEQKSEQLTPEQRTALEAELAELEGPRRREVTESIKRAREFGDIAENFEYHSAKNEQGLLERRIAILKDRLHHAVTVEHMTDGHVGVGSIVEVEDGDGEKMEVTISAVGGVSPDSPLGNALMGASVGDVVDVAAPSGSWKARVVGIRRA